MEAGNYYLYESRYFWSLKADTRFKARKTIRKANTKLELFLFIVGSNLVPEVNSLFWKDLTQVSFKGRITHYIKIDK